MLNKKVIVINGLARGGTNILWNVVQSHPNVCSPILETSQIIGMRSDRKQLGGLIRSGKYKIPILRQIVVNTVDRILYDKKLETIEHTGNKYKTPDVLYTQQEIEEAVLCPKGVNDIKNDDLNFNRFFLENYEEAYFVSIVRNGYSQVNSWLRRGMDINTVAELYHKYVGLIIEQSQTYPNYLVLTFEELLQDPFAVSKRVYKHCKLDPIEVEHIRLKVKKTINLEGEHKPKMGRVDEKHWFTRDTIFDLIDPNINQIQSQLLDPEHKKILEDKCKAELDHFGFQ